MIGDEMCAVFEIEYAVVCFEIQIIESVYAFFEYGNVFFAVLLNEASDFGILINLFPDEKRESVLLLRTVEKEGVNSEIAD